MDVDTTFRSIRSFYQAVSGKTDVDVSLTFKSNGYGVTKPYQARIDSRETAHETFDGALSGLLDMLKKELADKIKSAESEAARLKQTYQTLGN